MAEFAAGMQLLRCFDSAKYRLIMAKLEVNYLYQAKTNLIATAMLNEQQQLNALKTLNADGVVFLTVLTEVKDDQANDIALVKTHWQLKPWGKVRTKR